MSNIYEAPTANLAENTVPFEGLGSIENGIAGKYDLSIGAIISEAWAKTKGTKGTIWLAVLFYILVLSAVSLVSNALLSQLGSPDAPGMKGKILGLGLVFQFIQLWITLPLGAGFFMVGIKLAVRAPVEATEIFNYYPKVLSLVGTMLLMYLMVIIGFCLLILPGIYLLLAYGLAMPLVVEKNLSPWQALETSRKAITHRWFAVFGLYFLLLLVMLLALIPLGIGVIWALPMLLIAGGIVYRNIFGYEGGIAP